MANQRKPTALQTNSLVPSPNRPTPIDKAKVDMLAESIRVNGILTPIQVRRVGGKYEIINGESCWYAAKQLGMDIVPVEVVEHGGQLDRHVAGAQALLMNVERETIPPAEVIQGLERFVAEFGKDAAETVLEQLPQLLEAVDDNPELKPRLNQLLESCGFKPYS